MGSLLNDWFVIIVIENTPLVFTIFNASCVLCGALTAQKVSLCKACQNDLPRIVNACEKCGLPVTVSNTKICGHCIKIPPAIDYTLSLFHYESPVDYLISQLKFHQQLPYAAILGFLLKETLTAKQFDFPDVILPVPLHRKRLLKRGFNQSLEIARPVSKYLKIPIDYEIVRRTKATLAQTELNAAQRKKNIKGCFEMETVPAYRHIVLIDDVVTTGATTNELARILKESGVEKVGVWSIARAELF